MGGNTFDDDKYKKQSNTDEQGKFTAPQTTKEGQAAPVTGDADGPDLAQGTATAIPDPGSNNPGLPAEDEDGKLANLDDDSDSNNFDGAEDGDDEDDEDDDGDDEEEEEGEDLDDDDDGDDEEASPPVQEPKTE